MIFVLLFCVCGIFGVRGTNETLRLTGGNGNHEGNVQIYNNGTWLYICDDHWDIRDAKVICRQLNYTKALNATKNAHFSITEGVKGHDFNSTYWSTHIQCSGSEKDIRFCFNGELILHKCRNESDIAGVICTNETEKVKKVPQPSLSSGELGSDLQVRLRGEAEHGFISNGYLEVFYDGVWGAVCADGWTEADSYVACGHLGYPDVNENMQPSVENGSLSTHYWMNNVQCNGLESTLYECEHEGWKRHVCVVDKAVYLSCKRSHLLRNNRFDKARIAAHDVRLRAGSRHSEGRVEIFHANEWGSICDDKWDIHAANIFCRHMGFGTAFEATHHGDFGQGSGKVWLDEVQCNGTEKTVGDCKHLEWGVSDCGHKEDAGVKCHFPYGISERKVRLWGHTDKHRGHVEVFQDGKWQGVCGIGWGLPEAEVICRELGLGYPRAALSTSKYGMVRLLTMFDVKCSGDELSIFDCYHRGPDVGRCRYYDLAAVECSRDAPDIVLDVERLKNSISVESRNLMSLSCAYEEGCLASDAKRQMWFPDYFNRTLLRFTASFWNRGTTSFRPSVRKQYWEWHACHRHYHSMERFSDYDLTDENNIKHAEGHKASFCLEDYECEKGVSQLYNCARKGDQGVSVNCADTYKSHLDCQWVDITTVPYGSYKLRIVINPQNLIYESDYSNNIASCKLNIISNSKVDVESCQIDSCEQMSFGGRGDGACCKFPFIYKGKQYHSCITDGTMNNGELWCATTGNYDEDKLWGKC